MRENREPHNEAQLSGVSLETGPSSQPYSSTQSVTDSNNEEQNDPNFNIPQSLKKQKAILCFSGA